MTASRTQPLRLLTVCSHNRTRSVMMAAMLHTMLAERLGEGSVEVRSSGFGPTDIPAIADAVDAMRRRGLDVSQHRSAATTAALVDQADLVLTAEREHVVKIAALSPAAFRRTMTLPEFVTAAESAPIGRDRVDSRTLVQRLTEGRTASSYLREPVPEVADPTGWPTRAFERAVVELEQQCERVATWLAAQLSDDPGVASTSSDR